MAKNHWIAGSGEYGCLYDNCNVFNTKQDAIDYLVSIFAEDNKYVRSNLQHYNYCDLSNGADFCEISACNCDNMLIHSDSM